MTVRFLARHDWDNSEAPRLGHIVPTTRFTRINVHHTVAIIDDAPGLGDEIAYMRKLRTIRPDLGLDVPYSFVVFAQTNPSDCIVAEGRGWKRTGAHTAGENSSSYGVAFAGNTNIEPVTPGVLDGYRFIGRGLRDPAGARPTLGHRDHKATACPGANLYARLPELQPPFTANPTEGDTMTITEYIHLMFWKIAKRAPDNGGYMHWLDQFSAELADAGTHSRNQLDATQASRDMIYGLHVEAGK